MKIRRGKDIKLRWSVTVNDRPITADDDLTLVLINPRLEKIKLDYFIEDGALVFYFRGKEQKFLGEYKLTLWLNYGKENQTALDDTSCFTLVRFTDDEDNDLEDITEVELKGTVTISGDSAYEIWLKNGNSGTQTDFLESLKGAEGKQGIDGKDGKDGVDGKDGLDANSAIEVVNQETNSAAQKGAINVKSTGNNSLAVGHVAVATGDYSAAIGRFTRASGRGAIGLCGLTYGTKFTGVAGTTKYETTFQLWETPYLVDTLVYTNTTDEQEPAIITNAYIDNNKVIVELDKSLNPDTDVVQANWNPIGTWAKGTSAFANGGYAVGNQSAVLCGGRNISEGSMAISGNYGNVAKGKYSVALNYDNTVNGENSTALGEYNTVDGVTSLGLGMNGYTAGDGSINVGKGAINAYITATDTPCKYILDSSWNVSHNKYLPLLQHARFFDLNGGANYRKPIKVTSAEFVDGKYYFTTDKEITNVTSHTRVGIAINYVGGQSNFLIGNNLVTGKDSIVLGQQNYSIGDNSNAVFGYSNVAENTQNFINGGWLNTKNEFETAYGVKNKSNTGATKAEQTIFSVGNGEDVPSVNGLYPMGEGKNCLEIMRNGDIYFGGYGDGIKFYDAVEKKINITPTTITNGKGTNSSLQVNAYNCEASGTNSIATGVKSIASGNYSVAMGRHSAALGRGSVALGGITKGFVFTGAAGATRYSTNLTSTYANALYVGQRCHLSTEGNDEEVYTIQSWEIVDNVYYVTLDRTIDANNDVSATLYLLANAAIGNSAIAMGGVAKGTNSATFGQWNLVNGGASVALGSNNLNSGNYSFSAGYNNTVDGSAALALGHTNKAVGGQAIAIGYGNEATEPVAIAIGNKNTVPKQSAVGIGVLNDSIGSSSVAIGYKNKAHHHGTVTLGGFTTATNQGEVAVGIGNISHSGTRFSVGGANELLYYDATTNKNLLEIMSNGDIWIGNYNEGKKLWDVATGTSPLVEEIVNNILIEKGVING